MNSRQFPLDSIGIVGCDSVRHAGRGS